MDRKKVEELCQSINCSVSINDCYRLGQQVENRNRRLLVTFISVWDARILLAEATKKQLFKNKSLIIGPSLSSEDIVKEKVVLKRVTDNIAEEIPVN